MVSRSEVDGLNLYEEGVHAFEAGNLNEARQLLEVACKILPHHASAHHVLGKTLARIDQTDAAEMMQRRSCDLDPSLGWNWYALAELLIKKGDWREASEAFRQARFNLPQEGWISEQERECNSRLLLHGETLRDGLGINAYQFWCQQVEGVWPAESVSVQQNWILLNSDQKHKDLLPPTGWLVVLGRGYTLRPRALLALEAWLANWNLDQPDLITADEDRLDESGDRVDPWFKPATLAESSWSTPWFEGFTAWRCSWLREHEFAPPPTAPLDRFKWLLKSIAAGPNHKHAPIILCHQQSEESTSISRAAKAELIKDCLNSVGESVIDVIPHGKRPEGFLLQWAVPKMLTCTVIVPTRDRSDLLDVCLTSVMGTSRGSIELNWVVVDNGSTEPELHTLLNVWSANLGTRFTVIRDSRPFNWSAMNNHAVDCSRSDLLLFLNNDIEACRSGWLDVMAAQAVRPAVGCVGAVLLYPDGTIQHAGVVVGMHGGADHAYRGLSPDHEVHRARSSFLTDWGAVTGACMMVERDLFVRLGGFDSALPVEFNDVDFCLRLGQLGYRHVIDPAACLIHHESQSRDAKKSATAGSALALMRNRWQARIINTSPWWPQACAPHCSDGRPGGLENL